MNFKKVLATATAVTMVFSAASCSKSNAETTGVGVGEVMVEDSGIINGIHYSIYETAPAKYMNSILKDCDYYIDYLDEPNSPEYVTIAINRLPKGCNATRVQNISVDSKKNSVTITVYATTTQEKDEEGVLRTAVQVELSPAVSQVLVVDTNGKTLKESGT